MRLELYINDRFYERIDIPEEPDDSTFYHRVMRKEEVVNAHILQMKAMFFRQIMRAESFSIFLVESGRSSAKMKKD